MKEQHEINILLVGAGKGGILKRIISLKI